MARRLIATSALVLALAIPGTPALAEDGSGSCPPGTTGAQFGAHVADMARAGQLGAQMNPGMHAGYSHMAR